MYVLRIHTYIGILLDVRVCKNIPAVTCIRRDAQHSVDDKDTYEQRIPIDTHMYIYIYI